MSSSTEKNGSSQQKYQELPTQDQNDRGLTKMADVLDDEDDNAHAQCGLGGIRCRCLQVLAHPNAYVICVGIIFMLKIGGTGVYISGVISTIEKRFQLKSSESGILMSVEDIASLCGVLFVTHFGGKSHRPRIVGIAGLLVTLGIFVSALPQFIFDNPSLDGGFNLANQTEGTSSTYGEELICNAEDASSPCTGKEIEESGSQLSKTWPIILGQVLGGVGGTAILPLSMSYIDDAVHKSVLPIYLGLMCVPMAIGPLFAYSISGYCLSIHADFYKIDITELGISPQDPEWLGAWWLGFIIYGCLIGLFSIPFFFFPRVMSKPKSYCCCRGMPECCKRILGKDHDGRDQKEGGANCGVSHGHTLLAKVMAAIKDFLPSLRRLVTNPTYMATVIGYCMQMLSFIGSGMFAAKYIQYQFGVSASQAGLYLGFLVMPGNLLGIVFGGVVSRMAGSHRGYGVLTITLHGICVLMLIVMMFIGCDNGDIAGLTSRYRANATSSLDVYASCNADCNCEKGIYSPVCGSDNVTYVTACFAGCSVLENDTDAKTIYQDCSCIGTTFPDEPTSGFAAQGACASECGLFALYAVFLAVWSAVSSLSFNPSFMMKYRSVMDKDRDLSLGLAGFISKILGFIPAPIVVGAIIETQCSYWQESCEATGECLMYDRPGLRLVYYGYATSTRFLAVVFYSIGTYLIFKQTMKRDTTPEDGGNSGKIDEIDEMKGDYQKETDV